LRRAYSPSDDITETNEFIEDSEAAKAALLSQEEIVELRAQGVTAEELIQRQMERHERFGLKTDFSKEKWRKRKEKKYRPFLLSGLLADG
jgi:tRNA (adenine-N(1)-)-methyltransferase non-catalytic subunit